MESQNYSYLLGFIPGGMFLAMIFFAAIGVFIRLLVDATGRDQNSPNTPVKFKFGFLLKDNWKTIALSVVLILVTLRFAASVFETHFSVEALAKSVGQEKWLFGSLVIGFIYNSLAQYLKEHADFLKVKR